MARENEKNTKLFDCTMCANGVLALRVNASHLPAEMDGFVQFAPVSGGQGAWHWRDLLVAPPMPLACLRCVAMPEAHVWALSTASASWAMGRAAWPVQLGALVRTAVYDLFLARAHVGVVDRLICWSRLRVLPMRRTCCADMVGD
jgi:hypothetical protein